MLEGVVVTRAVHGSQSATLSEVPQVLLHLNELYAVNILHAFLECVITHHVHLCGCRRTGIQLSQTCVQGSFSQVGKLK